MELKTYQAYTIAEAVAAMKEDLGPDAVVLNTREVTRSSVLGLRKRKIVELTAGSATEETRPAARRSGPELARALASLSPAPVEVAPPAARAPAPIEPEPPPPATTVRTEPSPTARRYVLTPPEQQGPPAAAVREPSEGASRSGQGQGQGVPFGHGETPEMRAELAAIRSMVGRVLQRQVMPGRSAEPALPPLVFDHYLQMIGQDLSADLADGVTRRATQALDADDLDDHRAVREAVLRELGALVQCTSGAPRSPNGRPLTVALVGSTGVGKTTTLAKLAAMANIRDGHSVGLVTADTYRIAAVDQLKTYADIVGLPLQVARSPVEMLSAVHMLSDRHVVLIDTAGRGQRDAPRLAELRRFLDAAEPHEIHLVLAATASEKLLLEEWEAFAPLGVDHVIVSKLDQAVCFGPLINVLNRIELPASYLTTGQEVPQHFEPARPRRLAELVLGAEIHA